MLTKIANITRLKVVAICMRGSHIYCHLIFSLVVLSGSSDNPDFLGFLVQGKIMADGTIGYWNIYG